MRLSVLGLGVVVALFAFLGGFRAIEELKAAAHWVHVETPLFYVDGPHGDVASRLVDRLYLTADQRIVFRPELELREVSILSRPMDATTELEFRVPVGRGRNLGIRIRQGERVFAEARIVREGLPDEVRQQDVFDDALKQAYGEACVRLELGDHDVRVFVGEVVVVDVGALEEVGRSVEATVAGGRLVVGDPRGIRPDGTEVSVDLANLTGVGEWRSAWGALAPMLARMALIGLWLRAICLGSPSWLRLVSSTLLLLVPLHALSGASTWFGFKGSPLFDALAIVVGWVAAMVSLRGEVRRYHAVGSTRWATVGAVFLVVAAGFLARAYAGEVSRRSELERDAVLLEQMEFAQAHLPREPLEHADPIVLHAGNEWLVEGHYRDFVAGLEVELSPGSALEFRTRSSPGSPIGIALMASSDHAMATGIYHEDHHRFERLGPVGTSMPSAVPANLVLDVTGRRFVATIDGESLATGTSAGSHPRGSIRLLAHNGTVTIRDLRITPKSSQPWGGDGLPWLRVTLEMLAWGLAISYFAARATVVPWSRALPIAAFALVPLVLGYVRFAHDGTLDPAVAAKIALAVVLGFLVIPIVHSSSLTFSRYLGVVVLAIVGGVAMVRTVSLPEQLPDGEAARNARLNSMVYTEWNGDRLAVDWVHLQHPLLRRFNSYLTDHSFRGRRFAPTRPKAMRRVLCLGSSSTYGYGLPLESGLDYPTQLEGLLRSRLDQNVEVMNAAWSGATAARIYHLLRNDLLEFDPDVVTLSMFFNDAVAQSQGDEDAYYQRMMGPDAKRTRGVDLEERVLVQRERRWLEQLRARFDQGPIDCRAKWDELSGGAVVDPADRFERALRRFADLSRERGFELILIREAVVEDKPWIWKEEFYAAIERVGADYGLTVIDLAPRLAAAKKATPSPRLFLDDVHMSGVGCGLVAEELAGPVAAALAKSTPR